MYLNENYYTIKCNTLYKMYTLSVVLNILKFESRGLTSKFERVHCTWPSRSALCFSLWQFCSLLKICLRFYNQYMYIKLKQLRMQKQSFINLPVILGFWRVPMLSLMLSMCMLQAYVHLRQNDCIPNFKRFVQVAFKLLGEISCFISDSLFRSPCVCCISIPFFVYSRWQ